MKDFGRICLDIRKADQNYIQANIKAGRSNYKIWVTHLWENEDTKYIKNTIEELDTNNSVRDLDHKKMDSDVILEYFKTERAALEEADSESLNEEAANPNKEPDNSEVPYTTVFKCSNSATVYSKERECDNYLLTQHFSFAPERHLSP